MNEFLIKKNFLKHTNTLEKLEIFISLLIIIMLWAFCFHKKKLSATMDNGYIKINIFFPGHNVPGQCFFFSFTQTKQKLTFFFNTKLSYRCVCVCMCVVWSFRSTRFNQYFFLSLVNKSGSFALFVWTQCFFILAVIVVDI